MINQEVEIIGDGFDWVDPASTKYPESASIPLPTSATPGAARGTAIVRVPVKAPPPELATSYTDLWARFAAGATLPDALLRAFKGRKYMLEPSTMRSAVLGYGITRRIAAANNNILDRNAIGAFLVILAAYQRQRPLFSGYWSEVLRRTQGTLDNWSQARHFIRHPSARRAAFGITFTAPNSLMQPWSIRTPWTLTEFVLLLRRIRPSLESLRQLVDYADMFVRTRNAGGPIAGHEPIPELPQERRFVEIFIDAPPDPGAFVAEPPALTSSTTPMDVDKSDTPTPTKKPPS